MCCQGHARDSGVQRRRFVKATVTAFVLLDAFGVFSLLTARHSTFFLLLKHESPPSRHIKKKKKKKKRARTHRNVQALKNNQALTQPLDVGLFYLKLRLCQVQRET